ncbi:DUF4215 domain-containing protein [Candidatus Dojkabacteria bacterium]|uniref:Probable pectate lyase C n=1 Tax=Candidatus Dojkabacteria bacterium TaxID=2099670 RepID=A0A955LB88_9BACT|nr:DUF4215 domain-containing protein [Candidatus Dojkabacteria bacterium]
MILLKQGTYNVGGTLRISSGSSTDVITVANYNDESVTIDGRIEICNGTAACDGRRGNVLVEGVTIESDTEGYVIYLANNGATAIDNVTFKNVAIYGGVTEAIRIQSNMTNITFENSVLDGGYNNHVMKILCNDTSNEPTSCTYVPDNIIVKNNTFSKVSNMFSDVCAVVSDGGSEDLIQLEGAGYVEITNNTFSSNPFEDCLDIKGEGYSGAGLLIKNNYIDSTGQSSQACSESFTGCKIEGLIIHGSQHTGDVQIEGNYFEHGSNRFRTLSNNVKITNNIFDGSRAVIEDNDAKFWFNTMTGASTCATQAQTDCNELELGGTDTVDNLSIINNIINGSLIDYNSGQYTTVNNIIYNTTGNTLGSCTGCTTSGNLSINPVLTNTFRIGTSSPAYNSANDSYTISNDSLGSQRPQGTDYDIGAFEYIAAAPVCGNGVVESGETCDDGNTISSDGCSATCQTESSGGGSSGGSSSGDSSSSESSTICGPLDSNGNNQVDITDFSSFAKKYSKTCADTNASYSGCGKLDVNNDNKITLVDFANFAYKYGKSC